MQIKSNDRVFITGKTGSGKTTGAKKRLWGIYPRRIFLDVKLENQDLLSNSVLATSPTMIRDYLVVNKPSIVYQPKNLDTDDFNQVCEFVYKKGNYTLFNDEASMYCEPGYIPPWFKEIMVRGRSRGVGIVNLTQRPRRIHSDVISESEHFFIYRLQLETDVEKIRYILPKQYREQVYTLPDYHCIYVGQTTSMLLKPV